MIDSGKVKELVDQAIAAEGGFLVDLKISSDSKIKVLVDHKEGVRLEQLTRMSRFVEHNLDREENDFAIEVSSPGIDMPFQVKEQYEKNVGRPVRIKLKDGSEIKGDFTLFENDKVTVSWTEKVAKPVGKGKMKVTREEVVSLEDIKETSLEIRF